MTLTVDWAHFPAAVTRHVAVGAEVYLLAQPDGAIATAADPDRDILVTAHTRKARDAAEQDLIGAGFTVLRGRWRQEGDPEDESRLWVAAVAYRSSEEKPGLWVDGFPYAPTPADVLSRMVEEFREDGTLHPSLAARFSEFGHPNVLILGPDEISAFLERNEHQDA